jgi:hypothetical protein
MRREGPGLQWVRHRFSNLAEQFVGVLNGSATIRVEMNSKRSLLTLLIALLGDLRVR